MPVARTPVALVGLLSLISVAPLLAEASGFARIDGTEVRPSHAVAIWTKSTAFGDEGKRILRVLLATTPFDTAGIDQALDREGALRGSISGDLAIVTLEADGNFKNFYLFIEEGSQNYGLPGSIAEKVSIGTSQVAGRAYTEGEESLGDSTISYDLTFAADIVPERPPGAALGAAGGAPGAAYTAYLAGIHGGDVDAIIAHADADTAGRLREAEAEWLADELSMLKEMAPQEMTVTGGQGFDGWAILTVKGADWSGDAVEGAVKMVLDGDTWRFDGEDLDYVW